MSSWLLKNTRDDPVTTVLSPSPLSMRRRCMAHKPSLLRYEGVTPKSRQYISQLVISAAQTTKAIRAALRSDVPGNGRSNFDVVADSLELEVDEGIASSLRNNDQH
jgi:hypothetical protein